MDKSERINLTEEASNFFRRVVQTGDITVDATCGNGNDTVTLAQKVADMGHVFGFDIQQTALANTKIRLEKSECSQRVTLIQANHSELLTNIPKIYHGKISLVTFNLGYLPGGDKSLTTLPSTTISALEQAVTLLKKGGALSIIAYAGHKEGAEEHQAIEQWLDSLALKVERLRPQNTKLVPPEWFLISKCSVSRFPRDTLTPAYSDEGDR